ncbi:MAG: chemotaxis protein CheW [Porticoccaceae bacterium]|nr:chemotaxis protein CheW [Porticoccaceae bacterium]
MVVSGTVFEVVRELAQQFHSHSKTLPAQTDFMPLTAALCFTVLGVDLLIPLDELAEVQEMPEYARLPRVKPWMLGVASIRGKLVPIVDFVRFLSGETRPAIKNQRVLVLALQGGFIGVLVDSVAGVKRFETEQFREHAVEIPPPLGRYVKGCFVDGSGQEKYLFRPLELIEDELFRDVAV